MDYRITLLGSTPSAGVAVSSNRRSGGWQTRRLDIVIELDLTIDLDQDNVTVVVRWIVSGRRGVLELLSLDSLDVAAKVLRVAHDKRVLVSCQGRSRWKAMGC